MARIAVVGSVNFDLTFLTGRLPRPGETVPGTGFRQGLGGKGANQAVFAARLGASVALVGRIGADALGEQALSAFRAEGIDTTFVGVDGERPTGVAAILVDAQAQNCIVVVPGANGALTPEAVRAGGEAIRKADALLVQLEVPVESAREALRLARSAGVRTLLNPAPALPLDDDFLGLVDLCVPNETELEALTGLVADGPESAERAARRLLARGPAAVLVTLGARGALLVEADRELAIPTVPVEAVDPTAAGDAFVGALAVFLARGQALAEAARAACALAALTVTRPGAQASFPTRQEAEAWLGRWAGAG